MTLLPPPAPIPSCFLPLDPYICALPPLPLAALAISVYRRSSGMVVEGVWTNCFH